MRRFYQQVTVQPRDKGFAVLLDGRPILTPARVPLCAPTQALAERVAQEWRSQPETIDPPSMPLTQLLNTAIDRVPKLRAEIVAEIADYASTDLVCFRAAQPPELVRRQSERWDAMLDWLAARGARLATVVGIRVCEQDPKAIARIAELVEATDDCRLAALHLAAGTLGSVVLALALADGRLDTDTAFEASQIDELHQLEAWGEDHEARTRLHRIHADIAVAAEFLRLAR